MSLGFDQYNGCLAQAIASYLFIEKGVEEFHQNSQNRVGIDYLRRSYQDLTHQTERLLSDLSLLQKEEEFKSELSKKILGFQILVSSLEGRVQALMDRSPEPLRNAWLRAHNEAGAIKEGRERFAGLYSSLQEKMAKELKQIQEVHAQQTEPTHLLRRQESLKLQDQRFKRLMEAENETEERRKELEQAYAKNSQEISQIENSLRESPYNKTENALQKQKERIQKAVLLKKMLDFQACRKVTSLQALMDVYADSIITLTGEAPSGVEESVACATGMSPWEGVEQDLDAIENIYSPHARSKALYELLSVAGLPIQERQNFYHELQLKSLLDKGVPQARYGYFHGADNMDHVRQLVRAKIETSHAPEPINI